MKGRTYLTLVNGEWVVDQPINKYKAGYGKIYKLTNSDGLMYIGSTIKTLEERFFLHREEYFASLKGKRGCITSIQLFGNGWRDVKFELVEKYMCEDEKALHERERYWIEFYKNEHKDKVVNKVIPTRTKQEYYKDNREKELKRHKQYRKDNKEKVLKYRKDNKDKISQQHKQYYKNNRERLNAHASQQHRCICGGLYTLSHKSHHMKTAKHRRFDNTLNYLKEHDLEFYNLIIKDHLSDQIFNDSCKY